MKTQAPTGQPTSELSRQRRREVVEAFVELIARDGLEGVTLDDVARASGVQRSMIRHYVGNRRDLVRAGVTMLTQRYRVSVGDAVGRDPSCRRLIGHLFGPGWLADQAAADRALAVLFQEAARDEATRRAMLGAYTELIDEVAAAIAREHPLARPRQAQDVAYQIVCLAEQNVDLQVLGFPAARSEAAHRLALRLAEDLG